MKIQTKEEYEKNHEAMKDISDDFLIDLFKSVQDLYESISAEIAYRISKRWKVENKNG